MAVLVLFGLFLLAFVVLVRRHLIKPLQAIDRALSNLSVVQPAPEFPPTRDAEIQAVEEAIREQHALLIQNDQVRHVLEQLANKDGLTGLMNRRHFMQVAEVELQRAQRYRRPVTVAMADLDYFKKLNDTYGHAAGDLVLQDLRRPGARSAAPVRPGLPLRRRGVCLPVPEIAPGDAAKLAERLRLRCSETDIALPDGRSVKATVSIGLADASECPIEIALKHADEALYDAKHLGRNTIVLAGGAAGASQASSRAV
jgi:diguanylate cyclase (GGDEF)-like protein